MATMDDIARRLGVTKGTVSKALSGAADVSETMRKQVLETAVELGYNRINRQGSKKRLCIFVEHMAYQKPEDFGWEIITGFRKLAEPAQYAVDIVELDEETQKATPYDEYMLHHNYVGAFVLGVPMPDPWVKDFATCRTPTVLLDNWVMNNPAVTHVGINNFEAMDLSIGLLKELGHKKIGYLSGALGAYVYRDRYKAFCQALRQHRLEADPALAGFSLYTQVTLARHLPRLLKNGCTAIVCSYDLLAHSVMVHCAELGLRIPQDLSIVGFDDIPLCRYTTPPLTTIRQDRTALGKSAFYALNSQIEQVPISTIQLHARLIERGSTGPVPERAGIENSI